LLAGMLAALAAIGCRAPAAPPAAPPAAAAVPVDPDDTILANAGNTFIFRVPTAEDAAGHMASGLSAMAEHLGVDLLDPVNLAAVSADPTRRIVMSWGIVDPVQFRRWLAAPRPPADGDGFAVRFRVTIPVADAAVAASGLERWPLGKGCARPGDGPAWSSLITSLSDAADREAAQRPGLGFVCSHGGDAVVARIDARHRELRIVAALGKGALVAAAAAPLPPAPPELAKRLREAGAFDAKVAYYATPLEAARYLASMELFKMSAGLDGVDAQSRARLWPKGVEEIGALERLVGSPPQLFTEILMKDMVTSWTLTDAGDHAFASLEGRGEVGADVAKAEVARTIRLGGAFADAKLLIDTVHEAGPGAGELFEHFLWPHAAAFSAAASPALRALAPPSTLPFGGVMFELDRAHHRLWLRL
jgi:hypothetical protein